MLAAIAGALFAFGLLVLADGLFPKKADLATRLAEFNEEASGVVFGAVDSLLIAHSMRLLHGVKGDKMEAFAADVVVAGDDIHHIAVEKVKAGAGAGALLGAAGIFFGWVNSPLTLLFVVAGGSIVGYYLPDLEVKKKAAARRLEFSRALTAFMTLLGSSISGGGGIGTALRDATNMGQGWVFTHIRDALDEAHLSGVSSWVALEKLGRRLNIDPLIELAGSLTLAGTSGSRVTETLVARAESARAKELADVRAEAEAKSSKLGLPVGLIMLAWAAFMAFPALANLAGG